MFRVTKCLGRSWRCQVQNNTLLRHPKDGGPKCPRCTPAASHARCVTSGASRGHAMITSCFDLSPPTVIQLLSTLYDVVTSAEAGLMKNYFNTYFFLFLSTYYRVKSLTFPLLFNSLF